MKADNIINRMIEIWQANPSAEVSVNVRTHTTVFGVCQARVWDVCTQNDGIRLEITLPEGYYIAKRKGAQ